MLKSYKIIVVGPCGAGKTSLINKIVTKQFDFNYKPTLGVDFQQTKLSRDGKNYLIQFWDIAG